MEWMGRETGAGGRGGGRGEAACALAGVYACITWNGGRKKAAWLTAQYAKQYLRDSFAF